MKIKRTEDSLDLSISHLEMPENNTQLAMVFVVLGTMSKLGTYSINDSFGKVWEFDECITEDLLKTVLIRLGFEL